jgi:hypothetical protein
MIRLKPKSLSQHWWRQDFFRRIVARLHMLKSRLIHLAVRVLLSGAVGLLITTSHTALGEITTYTPPVDTAFSTATSKVTATSSPSSITIDFSQWSKKTNYDAVPVLALYRKVAGSRGVQTYNIADSRGINYVTFEMQTGDAGGWSELATFTGTDFKNAGYIYTDTTVQAGVHYEYRLLTAGVELNAGIRLPLEESRGKVVLVIDQTMQTPLAGEIAQLQADMRGDGWTVITEYVPRMAVDPATSGTAVGAARRAEIDAVRNVIRSHYTNDPTNVKAVYLLGKVPQPYLGNTAYDGHGDHQGAWASDIFYAEMDNTATVVAASSPANVGVAFPIWHDEVVNNTSPADARNDNVPNDGKLDEVGVLSGTSYFPRACADVAVGRVDFSGMTWFAESETELLRRYLRRAHDYRVRQGLFTNIRREMFWDNSWQEATYERLGNRWGSGTVGLAKMYRGDWFRDNTSGDPWLLGNGGGAGAFTSAAHVGDSRNFGSINSRAIFVSMFGSYFGDWGVNNNLLRAVLAGTPESTALSCDWDVFSQQYTGLGKPLAYGILLTLQGNTLSSGYAVNNFHGDLTLRTTMLPPVRNLRLTPGDGTVTLVWDAAANLSAESVLQGYHVYRSSSAAGPFTRITGATADAANPSGGPITATTFTDTGLTNGSTYTYLVKVIALTTENAGSYMNASIGTPVTVTPGTGPVSPAAPGGLTATALATTNVLLSWTDNATTETGFVIERKAAYDGAWTAAGSVGADITSFADPGPVAIGATTYYRVKATGAAADSLWSPEASVHVLAGEVALAESTQTLQVTGSSVAIPVERRFGSAGAVSVTLMTASPSYATAQPGVHYTATTQTLNWADGETGIKTVTVSVLGSSPWLSRAFDASLSGATGGVLPGMIVQTSVAMENRTTKLPSSWQHNLVAPGYKLDEPNDIKRAWATEAEGALGMAHSGLDTFSSGACEGFIYRQMSGDGTLTGRLKEYRSRSTTTARVGLVVRSGVNNHRFSSGLKGTSLETLYRNTGTLTSVIPGPTATPPYWFRITRTGDSFTAHTSPDGTVWTLLNSQTLTGALAAQLWGMNDDPDNDLASSFSIAAFDNVRLLKADRPTSLTATQTGANQVTLQWADNSTTETGYRVEMRTGSTGAWTILTRTAANTTSYIANGISLATSKDFRVAPIYDGFAIHDNYDAVHVQAFPGNSLDELGWAMIYKNGTSVSDQAATRTPAAFSVTDSDGHPGVNPRTLPSDGKGVLKSWPTGGTGRALFMFTQDQPLPAALYSREKLLISVDRKDTNSAALPMRFALRIAGQWYASAAHTIGAASTEFTRHTLDFMTYSSGWKSLTYVPGTTLTLGADLALPAGDIEAYGIFFDDNFNNSGVEIDTFRIGSWNPATSASDLTTLAAQGSTFENWAATHGLPTDGTGLGAPTATPANDGVPNLLKYAFGLIPTAPASGSQLPAATVNGTTLDFRFTRLRDATDITYRVERSLHLAPNSWQEVWNSTSNPYPSTNTSILQTVPIDTTGQSGVFCRLRVTKP